MSKPLQQPSYVVATNFVEACIYDSDTSQVADLPSMSKLSHNQCNNQLCNSRSFFKVLRDMYHPDTVTNIVVPCTEMSNSESKTCIIRNANSFGFDNVKLISFETGALIRALSAVKLDPEKNDVCICIFHMAIQICATILQFDGEIWTPKKRYQIPVRTQHEQLKNFCCDLIVNAPSNSKYRTVIVGYSKKLYEGRRKFFKNVFLKNIHFVDFDRPDEYGSSWGGFLTKGRVLSGEKSMKKYDVANVVSWEYKAVSDGKDLYNFEVQYQNTPLKKEYKVEVKTGTTIKLHKKHFISDKWIEDPAFSFSTRVPKIMFVLDIDCNEIVSFQVVECPNDAFPSSSAGATVEDDNVQTKPSTSAAEVQTLSQQKCYQSLFNPDVPVLNNNKEISSLDVSTEVSVPSFSAGDHIEFSVSKNYFTIYHVCGNERFPIPNNFGSYQIPAYVGFHCLPPVIGEEAQKQMQDHPNSTVYDFIEMFGKGFSEVQINPKWKFLVVRTRSSPFAEVEFETLRGQRRSTISTLMSIMFKHLYQIVLTNVNFSVTKVKVTFAHDLHFSNTDLLKEAIRNAKLELNDDN